jgi:diaminopimelate decarboxylase
LANTFGTPLYVYSATTIETRYRAFDRAFAKCAHTVCYSVKANSNLSILKRLARLGCGFDIVSGGELLRVLKADPRAARRVVFSGVGKTTPELEAALKAGILMFNLESESELLMLAGRAAALKKKARVALRVNPDVAAETHPYISTGLHQHKFGVPMQAARELYRAAAAQKWLEVAGISAHIGSQILDVAPFREATAKMLDMVRELRSAGLPIRYLDAGGGLGVHYHHSPEGKHVSFAERAQNYARAITEPLRGAELHLLLEPGRAIVAPAGALLTRVVYRKQNNGKRFLVVDAAMNDLIRPSLYGAHHEIVPVVRSAGDHDEREAKYDVVGPICETGDFFARDRDLPHVNEGDLLAVLNAGAYGMSLSSNYNTRPRAAEVLVQGKNARVIRRRETVQDLWRPEL